VLEARTLDVLQLTTHHDLRAIEESRHGSTGPPCDCILRVGRYLLCRTAAAA